MRIVFVDYNCDPSKPGSTGLSDLVWDMAGRLAQLGDDVHVVAPYTVDTYPDSHVQVHRFPVPPIGYRNIIGRVLICLAAYRELRRLGHVDVVHTPEYLSSAIVSLLARHTPVVFTEPGNIFERLQNGNPYDWYTTQVFKLAARISARRCARCIATSELMAGWWQRTGVSPDRIVRIPLGVDIGLFQPVPDAKSRLKLDDGRPMVLYAARLSRENGADVTLRAVARLRTAFPDVQLHVLGSGPERDRLRQLADDLGVGAQTFWHGWIDFPQLPAFYSAADAFAFSGFSGGTPRVLLQAMACGAPSIASAIGGIVDHVRPDNTGLLFSPGSDEELSAALSRVLTDRSRAIAMGQRAQAYVRDTVAWDVLIRRLRQTYIEITGASSGDHVSCSWVSSAGDSAGTS